MLFNSYIFILFFLPVALAGYYGLNDRGKYSLAKVLLIGMSLWFYAYFEPAYLLIILTSIFVNYLFSKMINQGSAVLGTKVRKLVLILGIVFNVGIIFYYKYFNFFLENLNVLFHREWELRNILMPLGISFFTFQQISYLVDSWRGETKDYSFVDYILFVSFFPQLIAGPIVFHDEMIPQFNDRERKKFSHDKLAAGLWIFSIGLFKKVLIADTLGRGADYGFSNIAALSGAEAVLVMLCYTLQLYFDFSGYCDMAIGIGRMFQIEIPLNFNSPYKAISVTDFWNRWHMTLSRFLRKYIYFPLGGSRRGQLCTIRNILIVFLVSGIWHGAAWTFVLWGVLHGLIRAIERVLGGLLEKVPKVIRWLVTFLFVNLAWILFRAQTIEDAILFYTKLFTGWKETSQGGLFAQFHIIEFTYIVEHVQVLSSFVGRYPWIYMAIVLGGSLLIALFMKNCHEKEFKLSFKTAIATIVMLAWSVVSFSGISTFLYFNF
ncbi:MAG: MBOAT family protein [Lachnospiraceae bacterium]|nr:MBOAT family protein [Lachnospiraceae bacterium]